MLPVHDTFLHAEIQDSLCNTQVMGSDRCAESMSGRGPWHATSLANPRSCGFYRRAGLIAGFKTVAEASAQV